MRGSLAAACAAVLVGMSPAGALPLASFAAAAAVSIESAAHRVEARRGSARTPADGASGTLRREVSAQAGEARVPSIYRTPGGPAPSQAPPAA